MNLAPEGNLSPEETNEIWMEDNEDIIIVDHAMLNNEAISQQKKSNLTNENKLSRKRPYKRPSTNSVGVEFIETFKKEKINLNKVDKERLHLEKVRLKFEIAKYKFENPGFVFDEEL